jgi:hypothetical protein
MLRQDFELAVLLDVEHHLNNSLASMYTMDEATKKTKIMINTYRIPQPA